MIPPPSVLLPPVSVRSRTVVVLGALTRSTRPAFAPVSVAGPNAFAATPLRTTSRPTVVEPPQTPLISSVAPGSAALTASWSVVYSVWVRSLSIAQVGFAAPAGLAPREPIDTRATVTTKLRVRIPSPLDSEPRLSPSASGPARRPYAGSEPVSRPPQQSPGSPMTGE